MSQTKIEKEIIRLKNSYKAKALGCFFKTNKNGYGEGDMFLGVAVPTLREIAKKYSNLDFKEINVLLKNKFHEIRLTALFVLIFKFKSAKSESEKKKLVNLYIKNTKYINNWDLVDSSAYQILGNHLVDKKDRKIIYKLANSKNMWEQRVAVVSTYSFIKNGEKKDIFELFKKLFNHKHHLIHKALGWMLREVGINVGEDVLKRFLIDNIRKVPRTTLRYAVEKFNKNERQKFLKM